MNEVIRSDLVKSPDPSFFFGRGNGFHNHDCGHDHHHSHGYDDSDSDEYDDEDDEYPEV